MELHPSRRTRREEDRQLQWRAARKIAQHEVAVERLRTAVPDLDRHDGERIRQHLSIEAPQRLADIESRVTFHREHEPQDEGWDKGGAVHAARTLAGTSENVE